MCKVLGMIAESATVAPEAKGYKYYGLDYRLSVNDMATTANVSVRTIKTFLKLSAMGYEDKINQGWSAAQCFAHAGVGPKRKPAPRQESMDEFKAVVIYLRGQVDDAEYEITRLRGMVSGLGGDPDG